MGDYNKTPKSEPIAKGRLVKDGRSNKKILGLIPASDLDDMVGYVIRDVALPYAKKIIVEGANAGLQILLYGSVDDRERSSKSGSRVSYSGFYKDEKPRNRNRDTGILGNYDVEFDTRGEAESILYHMENTISRFGVVSVLDMYDFIGVTTDHTSSKYGWTSVRNFKIVRDVREGYYILKPSPAKLIQ